MAGMLSCLLLPKYEFHHTQEIKSAMSHGNKTDIQEPLHSLVTCCLKGPFLQAAMFW